MLQLIKNLARKAGIAIMNIYNNNITTFSYKNDHSPLTNADIISNFIITQGLKKVLPAMPILSEETSVNWMIRKEWQYYWLIDPLDGTKEFIKKNGEFTVNIALIEHGQPIMGVIYAPALNLMYYADQNTAWKESQDQKIQIFATTLNPPVVVLSRSHSLYNSKLQAYLLKLGKYTKITIGSSLKFCLIAEGKAQLYPRYGPTNIWDTAAGHAIILAAGAKIYDFNGNKLDYSPKESFLNPYFQVFT